EGLASRRLEGFAVLPLIGKKVMRGLSVCQGLTGLCEAWMPNASPQGRVHGVSRRPLTHAQTRTITTKPTKLSTPDAAEKDIRATASRANDCACEQTRNPAGRPRRYPQS